jgi:peptidyl-dipeptidase A
MIACVTGVSPIVHAQDVAEVERFVEDAEDTLRGLTQRATRAAWVQQTYITNDTGAIAADGQAALTAANMELAAQAVRFRAMDLPPDLERKLLLLRTGMTSPAPRDPALQEEMALVMTQMEGLYGSGKYCTEGAECRDLGNLSEVLAESDDPDALLEAWKGWRTISPPIRPLFRRFVEIGNQGARDLGFEDLGAMWRSNYDMDPAAFSAEVERLWEQVRPLYASLHAHVRAKLVEKYGAEQLAADGPIPAHLLGNMWAQQWANVYDDVAPVDVEQGFDLTALLAQRHVDARGLVRYGEGFFTSLGFDSLPETFWQRSLFTQPRDRDVVCHASAWDVNDETDLRIKMCIKIDAEDFVTVHHELGHNFYQRAYNLNQPFLYRNSANDGFHEAVGDTVALSVTPGYLEKVGLLEDAGEARGEIAMLLRTALDKVAFLPFGLLVDQWRWKVFSGEIAPEDYNAAWWRLREEYQGVRAPVVRSESDFDPGAKYHVPGNTPYTRYFLAHVLQFQFHRALCREAAVEGPLHRCSVYGNEAAGKKLAAMLEMGSSRPWPEALETMTGETQIDATALLDYFAPLQAWLDEQNEGRAVGW